MTYHHTTTQTDQDLGAYTGSTTTTRCVGGGNDESKMQVCQIVRDGVLVYSIVGNITEDGPRSTGIVHWETLDEIETAQTVAASALIQGF